MWSLREGFGVLYLEHEMTGRNKSLMSLCQSVESKVLFGKWKRSAEAELYHEMTSAILIARQANSERYHDHELLLARDPVTVSASHTQYVRAAATDPIADRQLRRTQHAFWQWRSEEKGTYSGPLLPCRGNAALPNLEDEFDTTASL